MYHFIRSEFVKVSKDAKIRNRYNQVPHPTQDTNWKVTNPQLDSTNKSQEVSPFQAGDHKAHINRRTQTHNKHKTEKNTKDPQKKHRLGTACKIFYWKAQTGPTAHQPHPVQTRTKTHRCLVRTRDPQPTNAPSNEDTKRRKSKAKP